MLLNEITVFPVTGELTRCNAQLEIYEMHLTD